MPRLSAAAVTEAIQVLKQTYLKSAHRSALEAFVTGKRLEKRLGQAAAQNGRITVPAANEVVDEVFVVEPGSPKGRLSPIGGRWQKVKDSGRMTVWDVASRGDTEASTLFLPGDQGHGYIAKGLKPDAATVLGSMIGQQVSQQALQVFLLRNYEYSSTPTQDELASALEAHYGISRAEIQRFTTNAPLTVPLEGLPEWDPSLLPTELRPPASSAREEEPEYHALRSQVGPETSAGVQLEPRIERMVKAALASAKGVVFVGPPGTGKTELMVDAAKRAQRSPEVFNLSHSPNDALVATAEEGWTVRDLVGGETIIDGDLRFQEGRVLQAIAANRWLLLDEINRADMDKIFGGLLTWLAGQPVSLGRDSPRPDANEIILAWSDAHAESRVEKVGATSLTPGQVRYVAGRDWRLVGSYNAVDAQRVFRFGQALGRRFLRVPIPPIPEATFRELLDERCASATEALRDRITALYGAHLAVPSLALGPALFLRLPAYVGTPLAQDFQPAAGEEADDDGSEAGADDSPILTEGYLANVGSWLARADPEDLERLRVEVVERRGALPQSEWEWLAGLLCALA